MINKYKGMRIYIWIFVVYALFLSKSQVVLAVQIAGTPPRIEIEAKLAFSISKEFDDLYRNFKREQKEEKKRKKAAAKAMRRAGSFPPKQDQLSNQDKQYLEDFKKIPAGQATPLQPSEEE